MFEGPDFLVEYLNYMEVIKGSSINTVKEYYYDLRNFIKYMYCIKVLGLKEVDSKACFSKMTINQFKEINLSDIYSYLSYLTRNKKNAANARARKIASLKSFYKYLSDKKGILEFNIASELESPKIQKRLPKYLTLDESVNLLENVEDDSEFQKRDYCILTLFLNCGLRLSELVSIDLNKIRGTTLSVVGKGDKERTIYLNEACLNAINDYLTVRPVDGVIDKNALFISKRKKRISKQMVQMICKKYIIKSGLDPNVYSTHKLRHTAATLMYKYGQVDIRALQLILGHKSVSTTEIYTHVDDVELQKSVDKNPLANLGNKNK